MSKRQFKTQASSSRALPINKGFGGFGATPPSTLSYVAELPDLSSISDPNIVVAFKSLSKADGTTKTKALDLLDEYISKQGDGDGGVEDPVLEAWVQYYPRLAINNHRRVREQSHTLQVKLLKSARKRMERRLPDTVGSWLAGCFDRDGSVARAAQSGISSFLNTDDKVTLFWTRCQSQILDYAQEAMNETSQTLSDERSVSAEDAKSLYLRVICSSISLVANLLIKLNPSDVLNYQEKYEEYIRAKKLWFFASSEDSAVRKALYRLLIVCLEKQPASVQSSLNMISIGLIEKGLSASQSTSSLQLLQALESLTRQFPEVWKSTRKGVLAFSQLRKFIQRGSQGAPAVYWSSLQILLAAMPGDVLPPDDEECLAFLTEYRTAIQAREEAKQNGEAAWLSYFGAVEILVRMRPQSTFHGVLFRNAVLPVLEGYFHGTQDRIPVTTPAMGKAYHVWASAQGLAPQDGVSFSLQKLASAFIAESQTSIHIQPHNSGSYREGQKKIITEGHRWFSLLAEAAKSSDSETIVSPLINSTSGILSSAIKVVASEEGRPYSAAAMVEISVRLTPKVVAASPELCGSIKTLIHSNLPQLKIVLSPSSRYLVSTLFIIRSLPDQEKFFESVWKRTIDILSSNTSNPLCWNGVGALIANDTVSKISKSNSVLQKLLLDANLNALNGVTEAWSLFETALDFDCYADESAEALLSQILKELSPTNSPEPTPSTHGQWDHALEALEYISERRPGILSKAKNSHLMITTMLLEIMEISDPELASRALAVKTVVEKANHTPGQVDHYSSLDVIRWNLELEPNSPRILQIETLVQQAKDFEASNPELAPATAFFPDSEKWISALSPTLTLGPSPALGVMRPFGGAALLASVLSGAEDSVPMRGLKTFPIALRMALYTSNLVSDNGLFLRLPANRILDILHSHLLTAEVVNDKLDLLIPGESIEGFAEEEDEFDELRAFASHMHLGTTITGARNWQSTNSSLENNNDTSSIVNALINKLIETSNTSQTRYYGSKALGHLVSSLVSAHGWDIPRGDAWLSGLNIFSAGTSNTFAAAAILTALESNIANNQMIKTLCNRLISDVAGVSATSAKTFGIVVLLNATLSVYSEEEIPVAKNRLIFAVKQILSWAPSLANTNASLASESCRALQVLLPSIKDVYGSYWETAIGFCLSIWESNQDGTLSDEHIPMTGMSLKLYSILRKLDEANDDLDETLQDQKEAISFALVELLKLRRPREHKPLEFVDTLLLRLLRDVPHDHLGDLSELYPLLASENRNLQSAAYDLLRRALSQAQQQISVDILLEKKHARLPDELLSLLLDAPSIAAYSDEMLELFPIPIRGYLLSWQLVFESFDNASLKVRTDYTNLLNSGNYLGPLLNLITDLFQNLSSKSGDLSKTLFDPATIPTYELWMAIDSESPKRDICWLLGHLYYSCLKFVPSLARNWWSDCPSRQLKLWVNKWTEKVFSPILIQEVKNEVMKWAEEQDTEDDEKKPLIIKSSSKLPEINAGYEIDDMIMQIVVSLPVDYPLQGVEVRGVNRVAFNEKTWRAWQVICQGVMRHSTLPDGLTLFRDNLALAMAGKTECAICYSILAADKKLPDKTCGTCKNTFHAY
ncbi:hypothetical protein HYALB_00013042 [Hymenoscyphus albidus]|uniref:E3 ubiquitin-protein ligase listerin n=1 Tax=Hymenoscyphus albidus TaxID=595503 RepID=A0A9N9Q8D5_9HELO|nr:hypothetical protein HYALB_00013042 [Hymenoscyphus albidus]